MIQTGTFLNVIDNSGAKSVMCIKLINSGYRQRYGSIGSIILITVKSTRFSKNSRIKKGELHKALILRTKVSTNFTSCNYKKYFENSVVLLNKQNKLLGTRVFGMIPRQLKYSKFLKLTTLSSGLSF